MTASVTFPETDPPTITLTAHRQHRWTPRLWTTETFVFGRTDHIGQLARTVESRDSVAGLLFILPTRPAAIPLPPRKRLRFVSLETLLLFVRLARSRERYRSCLCLSSKLRDRQPERPQISTNQ